MRISDWSSDVCSSDLVGRRPHAIAVLRKQIVRDFDARQMAQQHTMRMQRAFGLASGARCINNDGRIVGCRIDRDQIGTMPLHFAMQIQRRSEEHTSELQSLMRHSYAVFCLKKKTTQLHK